LAEFLDKKGIPYVNQRGMSLTDSPALPALIDLLRAVLHPRDHGIVKAALGSPLLGWTHEELRQLSQLDHILLSLHRLRKSLFEKGFALFFQDFLYMTWHPDGMTVLERLLVREGGREFYHDLQQIVDIVLDHHYREWSGPEGLIPFLDRFSVWQANEDERIKRFQDPTKNGIKILTLHFSKGLEFDVVFALGLINRSWTSDELIPIEKNSGIILSPPVKTSPEYKNYFEEIDAEKMRQLYVALTRAKHRLYVPVALHLSSEGLELGEASPIDLFLARLENGFCSCEEIYEKIHSYDGKALFSFLDKVGKDNSITYSVHQVVSFEKQQEEERANKLLQPPKKVVVPGSFSIMTSFSHLASSLKGEHILPSEAPSNFENSDKTVHTLPANSETGIVVHQILEKLPFSLFKSIQTAEQALPLISPLVQRSLFKDWQETLATLVFHSLKTPFFLNGSSFCLADLELDQMYKEMPFLFPYDASHPIEGVELLNGLIRGVIDLIFSYKGKYYILDWKTNWLGPSAEYYEKESLQKAMQSHHYFLQANLYVEALRRYLRLVEKRAFRECFGGVIYLFLRGLNPEQDTGIYVIEGP
jgi:exodeoxyribonuclease V beta subunit